MATCWPRGEAAASAPERFRKDSNLPWMSPARSFKIPSFADFIARLAANKGARNKTGAAIRYRNRLIMWWTPTARMDIWRTCIATTSEEGDGNPRREHDPIHSRAHPPERPQAREAIPVAGVRLQLQLDGYPAPQPHPSLARAEHFMQSVYRDNAFPVEIHDHPPQDDA